MVTGETSAARVFLSGEATAISGVTIGVYLFRNTALHDSPVRPDVTEAVRHVLAPLPRTSEPASSGGQRAR